MPSRALGKSERPPKGYNVHMEWYTMKERRWVARYLGVLIGYYHLRESAMATVLEDIRIRPINYGGNA